MKQQRLRKQHEACRPAKTNVVMLRFPNSQKQTAFFLACVQGFEG